MKKTLRLLLSVNIVFFFVLGVTGILGVDERYLLVAVGHLAVVCILFFPIATNRKIVGFEPYTFFVLYVVIGTLGTSYIISFGEGHRRDVIMHGDPVGFFLSGGLWLSLALLLVGAGYVSCKKRVAVEKLLPDDSRFTNRGLHIVALLVFVISMLATLAFIQSTGGFSFQALSRKRAIEIQSGGEVVYGNAGYLRLAAGLAMTMLYVMLANYMQRPYKLSWSARSAVILLFLLSIALPFLSSSRATILYTLLGFILVYTVYRKVSIVFAATIIISGLVFFSAMTGLRAIAQRGETQVFVNPIAALAESGNGMSLNGTAHILDGVPTRMEYKLGYSYLTWITAPIPRSFWPGKPDVSMGKEIKEKVFQETVLKSGRPPSLLTEGYINFGWVGLFGSAFLFGYILRLVATSFQPVMQKSVFVVAIYFPLVLHLASSANGAASQVIVRILSDIIPVYMMYYAAVFFSSRRNLLSRTEPNCIPGE
ncbi:O-antigen polymerase [Pseudooceanicola sp. HF7]|uniref:O-antigen polymerase n=1 Tax=Pseudooceanicola sp. HF7 TaxID=2721560 RepID=UPI0014301C17|nr:oligosaccharide repeat unit polymerase [Pseudooceanicola sp. HF7]